MQYTNPNLPDSFLSPKNQTAKFQFSVNSPLNGHTQTYREFSAKKPSANVLG